MIGHRGQQLRRPRNASNRLCRYRHDGQSLRGEKTISTIPCTHAVVHTTVGQTSAATASPAIRLEDDRLAVNLYTFYAAFFLSAHLAFIIADNFFRMAGLMGFRPADFLETRVTFLGADLPFHFAQRCFIASEMRFRAAGLMRRRFWPFADLAWLDLGGRPRRAGWESSPTRAAIAFSIRFASCLSCTTMP